MLKAENKKIIMDEGDFGIILPLSFKGDLKETDIIKFKIKKNEHSEETIIEKEFTNLEIEEDKTICLLNFTQEESLMLTMGSYEYGIKQYRDDKLLNTIVLHEEFEVRRGV